MFHPGNWNWKLVFFFHWQTTIKTWTKKWKFASLITVKSYYLGKNSGKCETEITSAVLSTRMKIVLGWQSACRLARQIKAWWLWCLWNSYYKFYMTIWSYWKPYNQYRWIPNVWSIVTNIIGNGKVQDYLAYNLCWV